jgi:hypothetical protein
MSGRTAARLELASMVVQRLERLSADSAWAHVSSGYRGALIKHLDELERLPDAEQAGQEAFVRLDFLIDKGLELLAKAAYEIGDPELLRFASQPRPGA